MQRDRQLRSPSTFLLTLSLAVAVPALAVAQTTASDTSGATRIAVIDTERIVLQSAAGKRGLAELKGAQEAKERELAGVQQELRDLQQRITDGRLALAQERLAELQRQLEERTIALRRLQDDAQRELTKKRDEMLGQIDRAVMPIVNQTAKELGYGLIFRKFESGLIYVDEAIDITALVIQRLDAAAPAN